MEVMPKQPSAKGSAEWFTGDVSIDGHGADPDHVVTHISPTEGVGHGQQPEVDRGTKVTGGDYRGEE